MTCALAELAMVTPHQCGSNHCNLLLTAAPVPPSKVVPRLTRTLTTSNSCHSPKQFLPICRYVLDAYLVRNMMFSKFESPTNVW